MMIGILIRIKVACFLFPFNAPLIASFYPRVIFKPTDTLLKGSQTVYSTADANYESYQ